MKIMLMLIMSHVWLFSADIIIDHTTKLMWQDDEEAKKVLKDWKGAKEYCENLSLREYKDWRLPSITELQSIVDVQRYRPAIKKEFMNTDQSGDAIYYWSSTSVAQQPYRAWGIIFFDTGGSGIMEKAGTLQHVRCVREMK